MRTTDALVSSGGEFHWDIDLCYSYTIIVTFIWRCSNIRCSQRCTAMSDVAAVMHSIDLGLPRWKLCHPSGSAFHRLGAVTLKALSPQWRLVRGTLNKLWSLERSDLTGWRRLTYYIVQCSQALGISVLGEWVAGSWTQLAPLLAASATSLGMV